MLTLKKLVLVAACVACALSASTTSAAERHLRSAAIQGGVTETFALIAKDSDEDEDSTVESTDDEGAAMTMETFPLAIDSDKYKKNDDDEGGDRDGDEDEDDESPGTDDDESVEDSFEDSADVSIDDNVPDLNIEIFIDDEDAY